MTATTDIVPDSEGRGPARRRPTAFVLAQSSYFAMVALLAWMKTPIMIGGLAVFPVDAAFVVTAILWLVALARRETEIRFHRAYWLLGLYIFAMSLSLFHTDDPQRSALKLLAQAYLLALPVLTYNLIRTISDIKKVVAWWLGAAVSISLLGLATVLLFPFLGWNSLLSWPLHNFGTLPPGNYPRIELTFLYPSMLANYFGAALALVFFSGRLGWMSRRSMLSIAAAILLSAFFALTPGFGGVLFIVGAWIWYSQRDHHPAFARASLIAGCAMPAVGALLASVTPIMHSTAPFLVHIPGLPVPLAPSVRLLAWMEATQRFLDSPLIGHGIGLDTVSVEYEASGCTAPCVSDAHNTFLNIAVQCGIAGLGALLAIVWFVARRINGRATGSTRNAIVFALAIAWISGFALQGLVGSFEDARHLWIILGLILSACAMPDPKPPDRSVATPPGRK